MDELASREFEALASNHPVPRRSPRRWRFLAGIAAWALALVGVLVWLPNPVAVDGAAVCCWSHLRSGPHASPGRRAHRPLPAGVLRGSADGRRADRAAGVGTHRDGFGPSVPGAGGHPLFLPIVPARHAGQLSRGDLPGPVACRAGDARIPHLAFVVWMLYCDRGMRKQRATELARFRALKARGASEPLARLGRSQLRRWRSRERRRARGRS